MGAGAIRLLRQQMDGDRTVQQLEIGVVPVEGDDHPPRNCIYCAAEKADCLGSPGGIIVPVARV